MAVARILHTWPGNDSATEMTVEVDGNWRDGATREATARVLDLYRDIVGDTVDVDSGEAEE